jgi:hypothetical protein
MAINYDGMTPMARFVVETCGLPQEVPEMQDPIAVSNCGATIGLSEETTCSDTGLEQAAAMSGQST